MKNYLSLCLFLIGSNDTTAQSLQALGPGLSSSVYEIVPFGNDGTHDNDIYAGGNFVDAGGDLDADYLARWDGIKWQAVAPGLNGSVYAIAFGINRIYVGGNFTDAGGNPEADYIAWWDGIQWNGLGNTIQGPVHTIAIHGDLLYAGGLFTSPDSYIDHIAVWDGNSWEPLGTGLSQKVESVVILGDMVYAGGWFTNAGGNQNADFIAGWNGIEWQALGNGLDNAVTSLKTDADYLYTCGLFTKSVARWSGIWTYYDEGLPLAWFNITDIAVRGTNIFLTSLDDGVFHWNGETWTALTPYIDPYDDDVEILMIDGPYLYMGGLFFMSLPGTNNIARWEEPALTDVDYSGENLYPLISVRPVPAHDLIYYRIHETEYPYHVVKLVDFTGKTLLHQINTKAELDISGIPAGIFLLQVTYDSKIEMAKIIKY
jgi:hypothetical protein